MYTYLYDKNICNESYLHNKIYVCLSVCLSACPLNINFENPSVVDLDLIF